MLLPGDPAAPSNVPVVSPPPLQKSYAANVVLVILALFPGLINVSAVALLAAAIARDLHAPVEFLNAVPLLSDAALAFGCIVSAELGRRIDARRMFYALIVVSLLASLASALAPSGGVFLAAHVMHGLVGGMLFVVVLPPILTAFGSRKLPAGAAVLVPCLFGATTLGPIVSALVGQPFGWRTLFLSEIVVAVGALILGRFTLAARPPTLPAPPVDWYAQIVAALATAGIFTGVFGLAGHSWRDPSASIPIAFGALGYVALMVGEYLRRDAIVPVRALLGSLAVAGTLATIIGSAAFAGLQEALFLALLRVDGVSLHDVGFALWPETVAALAAGLIFARLVTTKWVVVLGMAGLALLGLAAALARGLAPFDVRTAGLLAGLGGLGAGLCVTPGLFLVALSFPAALTARAIALLNLLRLSGGFISVPGVEHTIGSHAVLRFAELQRADPAGSEALVRGFILGLAVPPGPTLEALRVAAGVGISDVFGIVVTLCVVGIAGMAIILIVARIPIRAPDLAAFDRGQPALESRHFVRSFNQRKPSP